MQLSGDALPLLFLGLEQLVRKLFLRATRLLQPVDADPISSEGQAAHRERQRGEKPPGLIETGPYAEKDRRPCGVPDAVRVGGDHMERVPAGRHVRVISCAARSRLDPVAVQPLQTVTEADVL